MGWNKSSDYNNMHGATKKVHFIQPLSDNIPIRYRVLPGSETKNII